MNRLSLGSIALPALLLASLLASSGTVWGQSFLEQLEAQLRAEAERPATPAESSEPGYLGLVGDDFGESRGVKVLSVRKGSPAQWCGVKPDDVIVAVDDAPIASLDDLAAALRGRTAGSELVIEVQRRDERRRLKAVLASREAASGTESAETPADASTAPPAEEPEPPPSPESPAPSSAGPEPGERAILGVRAAPVTEEARRRWGLAVRRGAVVETVDRGSPAEGAGIVPGSVIVALDGRRIDEPGELVEAVRAARAGQDVVISYYRGNQLFRRSARLSSATTSPLTSRPALDLGSRLGADGRRPVLGRLGNVLDELLDEAARAPDSGLERRSAATGSAEEQRLRARVEQLEQELTALRRRLAELEARVAPGDRAEPSDEADGR